MQYLSTARSIGFSIHHHVERQEPHCVENLCFLKFPTILLETFL